MRKIEKRGEPKSLAKWRAANQSDPNFGYGMIPADLRKEIKQSLVTEQGGLCAYTGRWIDSVSCHIEHPKPQAHCTKGEDVSYGNMLACVPAPRTPQLPYGAHRKKDWPSVDQEALFVSPLRPGCGERFVFRLNGEIQPKDSDDLAATETIQRLGLNHPELTQLRKAAINATLSFRGRGPASLDANSARRRMAHLIAAEQENGPLEPFCFVLVQALEIHIRRLLAIRKSRRGSR